MSIINGCSARNNCTQNSDDGKITANINGKTVKVCSTGNPEKDAERIAQVAGCSVQEAKQALETQYGKPQQSNQSGGCSSTKIGSMLSGETSW
ncbi:hypothetical protein [Candidatus Ruminimicrobium bovinum]|uniref:hypothetical protein n=1 Tax=Candidatus Ruminimicrobium bovinum TaxID=3242779 RepID=UPI0039B93413